MQFEYEPELLIEEVKKRPCIWDHDHPDFRSKHVKARLWADIVKELMHTDIKELSKSELRELELQLQKKWKSIRDCFQKYLVNPKTKKPYIYCKQLQFLMKDRKLPEKKKHHVQVGSSEESDDDRPRTIWKKKKRLCITGVKDYDSDNTDDIITGDQSYTYEEIKQKKRLCITGVKDYDSDNTDDIITGDQSYTYEEIKPEADLRQSEPIEQIDQLAFVDAQPRNDVQPRNDYKIDYEDTDKMFLLSLLPHLKSIPEQFRLNVKVELMNVLRTAYDNTRKYSGPSS